MKLVYVGLCWYLRGGGSANVLVLVNLERGVYAITSDLLALPAKAEEEGTVLVLFVSAVSTYMSAVEGSSLSVADCVTGHVSDSSVSVCL